MRHNVVMQGALNANVCGHKFVGGFYQTHSIYHVGFEGVGGVIQAGTFGAYRQINACHQGEGVSRV